MLPVRKHVGRADIAGADLAQIAEPGEFGEHQSERDRAEQIADREQEPEVRRKARRTPIGRSMVTVPREAPLRTPRPVSVVVDEASGNDGEQGAALKPAPSNGVFLDLERRRSGSTTQGVVEVDQDEIGRRAFGASVPLPSPSSRAGLTVRP